jgi:hypothetical protein
MSKQGLDAVNSTSSPLLTPYRTHLIELAARYRLPAMYALSPTLLLRADRVLQ